MKSVSCRAVEFMKWRVEVSFWNHFASSRWRWFSNLSAQSKWCKALSCRSVKWIQWRGDTSKDLRCRAAECMTWRFEFSFWNHFPGSWSHTPFLWVGGLTYLPTYLVTYLPTYLLSDLPTDSTYIFLQWIVYVSINAFMHLRACVIGWVDYANMHPWSHRW